MILDYFIDMTKSTSHVNILIPLAGRGKRFKDAGYRSPKPLIKIRGRVMLEWAMDSFNFLSKVDSYGLIFIVNRSDAYDFSLDKEILKLYPHNSTVLVINNQTNGQAETALCAREIIDTSHKLFIYNCDTFSSSDIWKEIEKEDPEGAITYFNSSDNRYSFVSVDKSGLVVEVAEKKAISNMASTGMYYFKHGALFVESADRMIKNKNLVNGEYYVMPCYTDLISKNRKIIAIKVKKHIVFGTPEELIAAEQNLRYEVH